tara:strand:+ start:1112 stop:1351 length:240 start_codon:yes stop_codon:yes gene_type:complete
MSVQDSGVKLSSGVGMKAITEIPDHLKFEESTLRAAAAVLHRRLIGQGLSPEAAARMLTGDLAAKLMNEHRTDMECLAQ